MSFYKDKSVTLAITIVSLIIAILGLSVLLTADTRDDKPNYNVKVTKFYPAGIVDEPTNITVSFSDDLVPDDSLEKLTSDCPLEFEPPLPGLARWIDNNKLRYFPDSLFLPSTEYKIAIKSDKSFLNGNRINESEVFEFRTPILSVGKINTEIIEAADLPGHSRLLAHVRFNYPLNPEKLLEHINSSMKSDGRSLNFQSRDKKPSAKITLLSEPFNTTEIHGKLLFTIMAGLNCIGGSIPLQNDYKKEVMIPRPQPLVVHRVTPQEAGKNGRIAISLSQSVALDDIEDYFSITPNVNITIDQHYRSINIYGNFKPGDVYTIDIRNGLTAINGQALKQDFSTKIEMPNLKPSLKFADEGYFLSQESSRLIGVETINVQDISVEVEQVFVNNIAYYLSNQSGRRSYYNNISRIGRKIFSKNYTLSQILNEPVNSTFDLGEVVGDTLQGIYLVSLRIKDRRWDYAQRRIMITDLGLLAKLSDNHLMVWVNSLSEIEPVNKAKVSMISTNNQLLCEGYTNSEGVAIFNDIESKIEGFQPLVITVTKGKDLSYLKFSECQLPSSEFDIKGRPFLTKGYEAFVYSDRGVYRPGETVHLVSAVRGKNGIVPETFPYVLEIFDPQGKEFRKMKLSTKDKGFEAIDIDVPAFAKTGTYSARAKIGDDIIGTYTLQVEEFMPDRIKTLLSTDRAQYSAGDVMSVTVNGSYLFGAPCDGNRVNGDLVLEPAVFKADKWPEYSFTSAQRKFTRISYNLPSDNLDKNGKHIYEYSIPENLTPPSALKMLLSATVLEDGGRAVSAYKGLMIHPYPAYIGIKNNRQGYVKAGEDVSYSAITVDTDGNMLPADSLQIKLYRIIYHTVVKKDKFGLFRYVSEEDEHPVDSTSIIFDSNPAAASFTPMEYGTYRIKAFSRKTGHIASVSFHVSGWGYAPWSMTNPDRLEMELDKNNYKEGETAKLLIKAPFAGKLLLSIEKDRVFEYSTYTLDSNTAEIELKVKREYSPNVYISATLLKSTNSLERFSPARAFGLTSLNTQNADNNLMLEIKTPDQSKPNEKMTVRINTEPHSKLTLAAVDYGIIQLTDFKTPDPFKFFFGQRRLTLRSYDIYSFIFPDIKPAESMLTTAGDVPIEAERKRHVSPMFSRRVKPIALWSGVIVADSEGNASVDFIVPQYNGKLKVMAVAFNGEKCGSATSDVSVSEKIIIQESLPRFMTFSDTFTAKITVFNNTLEDSIINIDVDVSGPVFANSAGSKPVLIPVGSNKTVDFTIIADNKPGTAVFEISASGSSDTAQIKIEMPNRPPQPLITIYNSGIIKEGSPAKVSMPSDWLAGTDEYQLRISSRPALRFARSIQYLLSYPYGCLEQTTSKVFPLLYFNDIAKVADPGIFGGKGADYFITEGIIKLTGMQNADGSFGYWPSSNVVRYPWSSIYASHFLVEARKAGYYVNDKAYEKIIGSLNKIADGASKEKSDDVLRIYAAYVLALADELENSTLESLKYLSIEKLPLYSKFQYAGAIALTKGPEKALWPLPVEVHPQNFEPETGDYFNSSIRANAILLEILNEIAPDNPSIPVLIDAISEDLSRNRWYTTQGTAWGFMTIGKYLCRQDVPAYNGTVVIDGKRYRDFNIEETWLNSRDLSKGEIEISINGKGNCYYYWQASGVPSTGLIEEYDKRLKIRREYLAGDGQPFKHYQAKLGDQLIVKLSAEALDKNLDNVIINDLLPTCLEVENPRLKTSNQANIKQRSSAIDYLDIRDDRLLLFTQLRQGETFTYYYTARIISSGKFLIPPVSGECMYDPTIRSAGSSGRISIGDIR